MPPEDNGVRFEADQTTEFGAPPERPQGFDLSGSLVRWGIVSNEAQAQYVLVGIALVAVLIAGYFIIRSMGGSGPPAPSVITTPV